MSTTAAIQAVAFDLDGLMFNTEHVFSAAGDELLKRRGHSMTKECIHGMLGRRPHEAFRVMCDMFSIDEPIDDLLTESRAIFADLLPSILEPMPRLFELLELLESNNIPKSVATSSPRKYLLDILGRFDLVERFEFFLTAEDVTHGKPHPEIYETASNRFGVDVASMLVLEDSEAGTRAAASAGAVIVSIPHEFSDTQDFSVATHVVEHLMDAPIVELLR